MSNNTIKDDKSISGGDKDASGHKDGHKDGTARQPGADKQTEGQRQQSTGQDKSGGQHGDHAPNRATQQGGSGGSKSSDDLQSKDPGQKGRS
jgi:hypothetical protein